MKRDNYRSITKILKMAAVLIFVMPASLKAHPHVFLDTSLEFVFSENSLEGVYLEWVFDSMFSSTVISDCDRNKNSIFDEEEIELVRELYFSNLKNYNYLCHISTGTGKIKIEEIKDFKAQIEKKKVVYSFFVPLDIELKDEYEVLRFTVYDDTYYIAVEPPTGESVEVSGISGENFEYEIVRAQRNTIYERQEQPGKVMMKFKK